MLVSLANLFLVAVTPRNLMLILREIQKVL